MQLIAIANCTGSFVLVFGMVVWFAANWEILCSFSLHAVPHVRRVPTVFLCCVTQLTNSVSSVHFIFPINLVKPETLPHAAFKSRRHQSSLVCFFSNF